MFFYLGKTNGVVSLVEDEMSLEKYSVVLQAWKNDKFDWPLRKDTQVWKPSEALKWKKNNKEGS